MALSLPRVEGIAGNQADVLLRITLRDGSRSRRVLKAEAPSFTINADGSRSGAGHSVTLALASLGVVHVPQAPIEAAIALSIYVLAVELISARQGKRTLTQRAPWAVARRLRPAARPWLCRSPGRSRPTDGGDPAGALLLQRRHRAGPTRLRRRRPPRRRSAPPGSPVAWPRWAKAVPAYGIGTMAAFWFLQRAVSLM